MEEDIVLLEDYAFPPTASRPKIPRLQFAYARGSKESSPIRFTKGNQCKE
jgi:hypothetical protein